MKTPLSALALAAGLSLTLHAQEPAPAATPGAAISVPVTEGSLLPADNSGSGLILYPPQNSEPAPAAVEPAPLPQASPEPGLAAAVVEPAPAVPPEGGIEKIRRAVRIRELKTAVLEDPAVQAQKEGARCAKTPEGRRVWMRNYYTLLYTKMERLDPSLSEELEAQLHDILVRYEQHHIRPSVLIECVEELPGSRSADHAAARADNDGGQGKKKEKKLPRLLH